MSWRATLRIIILCHVFSTLSAYSAPIDTNQIIKHVRFIEKNFVGKELEYIAKVDSLLQVLNNSSWINGKAELHLLKAYLLTANNELVNGINEGFITLRYAEKQKNLRVQAKANRLISDNYGILEDFEKAIIFNKEATDLYIKLADTHSYIICVNNLGLIYDKAKNYNKALNLFFECLELSRKNNDHNLVYNSYMNLGYEYIKVEKYNESILYLNKAIDYGKDKGIKNHLYGQLTYTTLAEAYYHYGDLKKAIANLKVAEELVKLNKNNSMNESFYRVSYLIGKNSNPAKALENYIKFQELKEMKLNQSHKNRISSLNAEFDNIKKESQIGSLNSSIEQNKKVNYLLILVGLISSIFGAWYFINNRKLAVFNKKVEEQSQEIDLVNKELLVLNQTLEKRVEERTEELKNANDELLEKNKEIMTSLLKGQTLERQRVAVELHDNLGGTLSAINWRLQALDVEQFSESELDIYNSIKDSMKLAYEEVRHISHSYMPEQFNSIGLKGTLEKVIGDINLVGKLKVVLEISEECEASLSSQVQFEIYCICLELMNNIIKHSGASEASLLFKKEDSIVLLKVSDNGIGFKPNGSSDGLGLKNIENRLGYINGKLDILSSNYNDGTTFIFYFPSSLL